MKKGVVILLLISVCSLFYAQDSLSVKGMFSLGSRSTLSFFDHHGGSVGVGMGGQFRIQLTDRVNTEWYADYLNSEQEGVIGRRDLHIGWSVFYYYLKNNSIPTKVVQPFFEVGHCFDYTNVSEIGSDNFVERWSSAVQAGTGVSFNITPRFDFTTKFQYMIHLGSDVHSEIEDDGHNHTHVHIEEHKGVDLEGHLLWTFSLNYKIVNLWK